MVYGNRKKFCLGPLAAVASFLAILGYFAMPMKGLVDSGQYSLIPEILPWSFGLFVLSNVVGLMCAAILWSFGGKSRWQTIAFSGSQGVLALLLVFIGMVGNRVVNDVSFETEVHSVLMDSNPDESVIIADTLWELGQREAALGNYDIAINAMKASVNIHPADGRSSELLAIELLYPSDPD